MEFDRKVTVGGSEVAPFGDPIEFGEKSALVIKISHMFDDGIGVDDIESVVGKREGATITGNSSNERVASLEGSNFLVGTESDRGNFFWCGVVFFEVVVGGGVLGRVNSDIDDGLVLSGCDE